MPTVSKPRRYTIGFFVDRRGRKPVEEYLFLRNNETDFAVLILVIQRLSIVGQGLIDTDMVKHLEGPIFELRKDRHRILYAQDENRFVLLSAFLKETQKTPPEQIARALKNYREYQETGKFFELKLPSG